MPREIEGINRGRGILNSPRRVKPQRKKSSTGKSLLFYQLKKGGKNLLY